MISVICCYNNKSIFNKMLKKSVDIQNIDCEIIGIDTIKNKFNSAASALNHGVSLANGDYYIFAHQDIELYGDNFIELIVEYIDKIQNCIVGVAGKKDSSGVYTNICHKNRNTYAGKFRVKDPVEVQTLDECLIAMSKEVYERYKFDELTCDNWHLYSVDLCLTAKKDGIKVVVLPLEAFHSSGGIVSKEYWKTMDKLVKKHKGKCVKIFTTCSNIDTRALNYLLFRLKISTKWIIKKIINYSN